MNRPYVMVLIGALVLEITLLEIGLDFWHAVGLGTAALWFVGAIVESRGNQAQGGTPDAL